MEKAMSSPEGSPRTLSKFAGFFTSPRKIRTEKSLTGKLLHRIGRTPSESSTGSMDRDCPSLPQWIVDSKLDIAAATSLEDVKDQLIFILDRVHILECDVQRERQALSKELDMIKKHKHTPFKSLSGFLSKGGSSDVQNRQNVSPIIEESAKPRRKSATGIVKSQRKKLFLASQKLASLSTDTDSDTDSGSYRRRCASTSVMEKSTRSCPASAEIQTWAESFDALLNSESGRKLFGEFLRSEYSEENILFWIACEHLRQEQNRMRVEEEAMQIYDDFICCSSPREVSLDFHTKEVILQNMKEPSQFTFDEAQEHIYHLMRRDSFPRFINSVMFRNEFEKAN